MGYLNPSNLELDVQGIPPNSEVIKILDDSERLIALFVCSPMAVKKERFIFTSVLLDNDYSAEASEKLNQFLKEEQRGAYKPNPSLPQNVNTQSFLKRRTSISFRSLFIWGLLISSSLIVNLSLIHI